MTQTTRSDVAAARGQNAVSWTLVALAVLTASVLGGCAAPAPVVITDAEQAARMVFTCPNAKTLEVTRAQGGQTAIVVVDGRTLQLPRDASAPAERYTNRLQTLNIYGNSATFESLGQATYGPCTGSVAEQYPAGPTRGKVPRGDRD